MSQTHTVVFDIETAALPFESFDQAQQDYLLKLAELEPDEEKKKLKAEELKAKLSLYPYTAQVIVIGMLNVESRRGVVYYQESDPGADRSRWRSADGLIEFLPGSEVEILQAFWQAIPKYRRFVTFNGRRFDCPFVLLRSALLDVQPTRNLMPYRYDFKVHCDLMEQLDFYGATRKYTLDFLCKAFGIDSPKAEGINGAKVGQYFAEGRCRELAEYCLGDVQATAELYRHWQQYLSFERQAAG